MHSLPVIPLQWNSEAIDSITSGLTSSLISAASAHIPPKLFNKVVRPNWNSNLKKAQKKAKNAYRAWCHGGKPRNSSNHLRIKYKEFKKIFRRELRRYKRSETDKFYNSLDLNDRNLYHQIRLRRGVHIPSTNKLIWDSMSFDGSNILDGWTSYFQSL